MSTRRPKPFFAVNGGDEGIEMESVSLVEQNGEPADESLPKKRQSLRRGRLTASEVSQGLVQLGVPQLACLMVMFFLIAVWLEHLFTLGLPNRRRFGAVRYTCPDRLQKMSKNDIEGVFEYYKETNDELDDNDYDDWENYLHWTFHGWDSDYKERKKRRTSWVKKHYDVESGANIYEGACGLGLSLIMTKEILEETKGIKNLGLYGNDYIEKSVIKGRDIMEHLAPENGEVLCLGDSTNLPFVPSSSFDLVYTGYVDPIVDPLHLSIGNLNEQYDSIHKLCKKTSKEAKKLVEVAQKAEEDWFAAWVTELVRIAKPGKVVAIEEVGMPICDANGARGGVSQDWWGDAIELYGWDVDPFSLRIEMVNDKNDRYNVVMLKNE